MQQVLPGAPLTWEKSEDHMGNCHITNLEYEAVSDRGPIAKHRGQHAVSPL